MNAETQKDDLPKEAIEGILGVTSDFMYLDDVDELLKRMLVTVSKTFGLAKAHICIRSKETGLFEPQAFHGYEPRVEGARRSAKYTKERILSDMKPEFRVGKNTFYIPAEGYSLKPEEMLIVSHPERIDSPRKSPDEWHELDYIDFLMYEKDGSLLGYLEIDEPTNRRVPSDDVLKAIEIFSHLAAIAIQNSELYQQEARDRKDIELLVDLIGHDVSNYAQAASGYVELGMRMDDLTEAARKCLVKASDQIRTMRELISKIKLYAKVETSNAANLRPMDIVSALKEGFGDAKLTFHEKQVRLELEDEAPKMSEMNELGKEIFLNIFSNAIKFDEHPEVVVEAAIGECRLDDREYWCVSISDHGPGIPDEAKDSVFDRFTQRRRGKTGTGLGLHITKRLVANYKGRVWIEDRERGRHSQGCVLKVALPKALCDPQPM